MNCIAQSLAKTLKIKPAEVYLGVGHGEPIHMSEVIAWLLTRGYAAVPQEKLTKLSNIGVIEGLAAGGEPHMVPLDEHASLEHISIIWYFLPVQINPNYVRRHDEIVRLGVFIR